MPGTAAIVTVGSELVEGLRLDTNTAEIARAIAVRGWRVVEAVSIGDDVVSIAATLSRLTAEHGLVVATGGLGPTHDDVTREGASRALGMPLVRDERIAQLLRPWIDRHNDEHAGPAVLRQALVLEGAEVIDPTTGTAPGLVIPTASGLLALLPGPPPEMRPMLDTLSSRWEVTRAQPRELGVAGMTESDAQLAASRALKQHEGIGFTILSRPGDVRILLFDEGGAFDGLERAADDVADALGADCYTTNGSSLEAVVVREAIARGITLTAAESCTGGMVAAALTSMAGSSETFRGSVVSYHDDVKAGLLGVPEDLLERFGAVSEPVALAMAEGARLRLGSNMAVAVTGIAGPGGGTADKPVGLVWFAVSSPQRTISVERRFPPASREAVRMRATATALDLLRREMLGR